MPLEIIEAYAFIKKAAAISNHKFGILSTNKMELITQVCDEILQGELKEHFPLVIWQTGSGTHTNMNCNEVISNRAKKRIESDFKWNDFEIHPNDDVNKSQSSNDTFSAAMHIAAFKMLVNQLIPAIVALEKSFQQKAKESNGVVKLGRTHFMDAVPITLGQEFTAFASQIKLNLLAIEKLLPGLQELPMGGTAVGTGLNTPPGFDKSVVAQISKLTGLPFIPAENKFALIASHDILTQIHSSIKNLAISLLKIVNDIRALASGPRAGISELILPENEAGSSIMPGKVNPTQIEALSMVCAQVVGNDVTISLANSNGQFQLNTYKPVIISNFLQSVNLLSDACISFERNCLSGIKPATENIKLHIQKSLMLITSLTPHIGYEKAAQIAKHAYQTNCSLKHAAAELNLVSEKQFDDWVIPEQMVKPNVAVKRN
jgi:fumarate hydratase class II